MNEKLVQRVLDIEDKARARHEAAEREAEQLPARAGQEAQDIIEKERADAQEEARQLAANAEAEEECARILAQAEAESQRTEALAASHFSRAVAYVLDRVAGKE